MVISSSDKKRSVYIGTSDILHSLYSTIRVRLDYFKSKVSLAFNFLELGECDFAIAVETARQFNLIRDELSKFNPQQAVYDYRDLSKKAPWEGKISPVITSCANFYTTSDGKDLLFEIVSILCYGYYSASNIAIM